MRLERVLTMTAAFALGACGTETPAPTVFHLNRPNDVGFACVSGLDTALPLSACAAKMGRLYAFVLEAHTGDAVVYDLNPLFPQAVDSEPLGPGVAGIPVGKLPVEIATMADGAQMVVANQGSCDLSLLDVVKATKPEPGVVTRREVKTAASPLVARPSSLVAAALLKGGGTSCAAPGSCPVYVSYPGCHLVAVIDPMDGSVLKGVRFPAGGVAPEIVEPSEVSCAAECGAASGTNGTGLSPRVVSLDPDDSRLYVGASDASALYVLSLGADGLPSAVATVALAGAGGLLRIVPSGDVVMDFGTRRYVYAVGDDQAVHVVDVTPGFAARECDTQIDPRFLHDRSDEERACVPVGSLPRRAGAQGPGIRLPRDEVPLDVGFLVGERSLSRSADNKTLTELPSPSLLNGTFAIITTESSFGASGRRGRIYYVNLWDENLRESLAFGTDGGGSAAKKEDLARLVAHQLRDGIKDRDQEPPLCMLSAREGGNDPVPTSGLAEEPKTSAGAIVNFEASTGDELFSPMLHREICTQTSADPASTTHRPLFELSPGAPTPVREVALTDQTRLHNETWTVAWEGRLDGFQGGVALPQAGAIDLFHPAGSFCEVGLEEKDIVQFLGCQGDSDCGLGEVCFVHPDAPTSVSGTSGATGLCFPGAQVAELSATCHDVLVSRRRYTAVSVAANRLLLAPRLAMFTGTPVGGCASDAQCNELAGTSNVWACVTDSALGPGKRCVHACRAATAGVLALDCDPGAICDQGLCVEGPIPPAACLAPLQRFSVRAGEAYTLSGATARGASFPSTGVMHRRLRNPATGLCEDDALASPLLVGRFRRDEPACTATGFTIDDHNPCSIELTEPVGLGTTVGAALPTRKSQGVRLQTPGFTIHIADVILLHPSGVTYSPAPDDYAFEFAVSAGFVPYALALTGSVKDGDSTFLVTDGVNVPVRVRHAPDGALWIVDISDGGTDSPRGQVVELSANFRLGVITTAPLYRSLQ